MWLPLACLQLETWPATQACAPTGNLTSKLLVCRPALNSLSHTHQPGRVLLLYSVSLHTFSTWACILNLNTFTLLFKCVCHSDFETYFFLTSGSSACKQHKRKASCSKRGLIIRRHSLCLGDTESPGSFEVRVHA